MASNYNNPGYAAQNYGPRPVVRQDPYARALDIDEDKLEEANRLLDAYAGESYEDPLLNFMRSVPARTKPKPPMRNEDRYEPQLQEEDVLDASSRISTRKSTYPTPKRSLFTPRHQYSPTPHYYTPQHQYPPYPQSNMPPMPNYGMYPPQHPLLAALDGLKENAYEKETESEVRRSLEKQNMFLENLAKTLEAKVKEAKKTKKEKRSSIDPDAFEERLRKYERENELKQMIQKTQEKLEALEKEKLEKEYESLKQKKSRRDNDLKDQLLKEQNKAMRDLVTAGNNQKI